MTKRNTSLPARSGKPPGQTAATVAIGSIKIGSVIAATLATSQRSLPVLTRSA